MLFRDRADAGRKLAALLALYADREDVLVLGLPRGGVVVAFEVAEVLNAPLDVLVVRKLGVPGQEELAMGAVASGDILILNEDVLAIMRIPDDVIDEVANQQREELLRREQAYRRDRPFSRLRGRCVILIDDGLATGASMEAAVAAVQKQEPARTVVAVPVAAEVTYRRLRPKVDELVCLATPEPFGGVGQWYIDFRQTTDWEVRQLLEEVSRKGRGGPPTS
jgi:putative phosphoribosyl transferase